jgi:hypothetical protein
LSRGKLAIIVISLAFLAAGGACAESVFSVNGIGETIFGVDARGMAMGGAGLANPSPWHISLENPALLARIERFSFGAALVPETRNIELEDSEKSASFAYFPFLRLTHGLPGGITGAAAIGSLHRVSYRLEERRVQDDLVIVDEHGGEGGPGFVSIALAGSPSERIMIGAELRVLLGTIEDTRTLRYVGEPALQTRDVVKSSFGGEPLGRLGMYVDLGGGFGVGGFYQFSRVMDVRTTHYTREARAKEAVNNLTYPAMGGVGVSYRTGERGSLTAEWHRSAWGQTGGLAGYNGEMTDADRVSIGAEYAFGDDYRIPLRVGYLWRELSYRISSASEAPTEFAVTGGFGLPFRQENGSFDVSVQIGARGDVETYGARERFLRFTLSMVGTEFLEHLIPGTE